MTTGGPDPGSVRAPAAAWRRVLLIVLGTAALGALLAVIKGRDLGPGYFIGNLSAPYLAAAFLAGRAVRRRWLAGAVGVLATWATLAAFSVSAELVFGYPSGSMTRFYAEWFLAGTASGTAMGLLGRASRERRWLGFVLPLALVLEPFAVVAVQAMGRFGGLHLQPVQLLVWSSEVVLGLAALALSAGVALRRRTVARGRRIGDGAVLRPERRSSRG